VTTVVELCAAIIFMFLKNFTFSDKQTGVAQTPDWNMAYGLVLVLKSQIGMT